MFFSEGRFECAYFQARGEQYRARNGIVQQEGTIELSGTVECDEVYVIAGHKGHPNSVKKKDASPENAV